MHNSFSWLISFILSIFQVAYNGDCLCFTKLLLTYHSVLIILTIITVLHYLLFIIYELFVLPFTSGAVTFVYQYFLLTSCNNSMLHSVSLRMLLSVSLKWIVFLYTIKSTH